MVVNRASPIQRLVERKMASSTKNKLFCLCMARKSAGEQRAASSTLKQ
jgi:hypothetical protein